MKLRYYSDLHLEFGKFNLPPAEEPTILVLAGDIGIGTMARPLIEEACKTYEHVIYVLGNHEFYNRCYLKLIDKWRSISDTIENFHFLENDTVELAGYQFVGCTLWTDMRNSDPVVVHKASYYMNDFKNIQYKNSGYTKKSAIWLTPYHTIAAHNSSKTWMETLDWSKPTIVVTHHTPHECFLDLDRDGYVYELRWAYHTDLSEKIKRWKPKFWIAGHTHLYVDVMLHDTRLLSNPRGYVGHETVTQFNRNIKVQL